MRVLFISRKYPPIIGGMENYAYFLHQEFKKHHQIHDIILGKRQWHLIWFYPWIFIRGIYLIITKKIDLVYVGDGVLSSVAWFFQSILRKKVILTIHGLDVIYQQYFYQKITRIFMPKVQLIVANSQATKQAAIQRGVANNRITVIPVGVNWQDHKVDVKKTKSELSSELGISFENKTILFTIGRLVERKGIYWFVKNVMPTLYNHFIYIIAGSGPDEQKIKNIIQQKNLSDRVYVLGKVDENIKIGLFSISDIFISPNIKKEDDMEGFGIVNLEAGTYGLPVVAACVDGVQDAVNDGKTGYLVPEKNIATFREAIQNCLNFEPLKIENFVKQNYSWEAIYHQYERLIVG